MDKKEIKLALIEEFSKPKPKHISEYDLKEFFSLFRSEFWTDFKKSLATAIREDSSQFTVDKYCVKWYNQIQHPLLAKYNDINAIEKARAFDAFIPIITKELNDIGIPYEIDDFAGKRIVFKMKELEAFSNHLKLDSLIK